MRTNKVLEKMKQGKRAVGCALVFPSTDLVELIGMAGMDFVYIDFEHGGFSPESHRGHVQGGQPVRRDSHRQGTGTFCRRR